MRSGEDIEFFIEDYEPKYKNILSKIYLESYKNLEEYSYHTEDDVKVYLDWLYKRDKEGLFVVKASDKIVGFLAIDKNWFSKRENKIVGAIHEIFIDPTYQKKGIGSKLINIAIDQFKKNNLGIAELWVGDENKNAIEFYKKLGFNEAGRANFWIRMVKEL